MRRRMRSLLSGGWQRRHPKDRIVIGNEAAMTVEAPAGEQRTLLQGVSWTTYEALLADLGEHAGRLAYDQGMLEIMSPSGMHEGLKKLLGRFIEAFTEEL